MAICAFLVSPIELSYYEGLIKQFPPDFIDVLIGEITSISHLNLLASQQISTDYYHNVKNLQELGYTVKIATNEFLNSYVGFVASANILVAKDTWLDFDLLKHKRIMWLFHASDAGIFLRSPARYVIGNFQRSLERPEKGKVLRGEKSELFDKIKTLPESQRGEYAYSGPFHLGEWEEKRFTPKVELREEMCRFLGIKLPDKPVVAFFRDEYCYNPELARGLRQLSKEVTVIYKGFKSIEHDPLYREISNSVIRWPSTRMAQHLLRFSVDLVLAGFESGTMTSSAMLTVPMIAYHTTSYKPDRHLSERIAEFTPETITGNGITHKIHAHLDVLRNIEDTAGILDFLEKKNEVSLENSNEAIARLKPVFGDYIISGASQKAAMMTVRVMSSGSFGKDTYAVKDMSDE